VIATLPWVRTPDNSTHSHLVTRLFATEGRSPPDAAVQADDESVITNLVVSGAGLALVRDDIAERLAAAGDVVVWDTASIETTLWFISLARRAGDPLIAALLEAVRATWDIGHVPIEHRALAVVE